ncbi:MAG: ABC transporter permease subunit [Bacillota bacterium]|nr:ABC transporter permease subunit [Bacillota bacterium]
MRLKKPKDIGLYLLLIPGVVVVFIFCYVPMLGLVIAFQDYSIFRGIRESAFVGLEHFIKLFSQGNFTRILRNTVMISVYRIIFGFPIPIILALFINEIRSIMPRRIVQTVIYLPHFLSWVIVYGLFVSIFSASGSIMRALYANTDNIPVILTDARLFRSVLVGTSIWKESGWGTVLYMAAITSIDPQLYESAIIDGAGRLRLMRHITIPGIAPTIIMVLIIRIGSLIDSQTEQVLLFLNPLVYETGDVIGTYVYRMGLSNMEYSFSTAVGLFGSIVGFSLMLLANTLSKKHAGRSIW